MERAKCKMSDCILYCLVIPLTYTEIYSMYCFGAGRSCFYSTLAQAEVEHMMAVLKQKKNKKKNWWNFTYCLQKLECCHERWVSPNSASISCWTPLNSLSCFPAWACRIEARHSVCTGDLTHRKWKLWLCMCVCCLRWVGAWGWGWNRICWE